MPDPSRLALFVGAALLLLVVPGPSVLYIVTQSVSHGRRAGIVSVAGITTGTLVHIAAATVGLSALLASSALAFDVVKYLGAAYLIAVGIRRLAGWEREPAPRARRARATSAASTARGSSSTRSTRRRRSSSSPSCRSSSTPAAARRGCRSSRSACSSPRSASSATAPGRSSPGRSASAYAAAAASRRCSATSPARSSSASAPSPP